MKIEPQRIVKEAGYVIFEEGEASSGIFLVQDGIVEVYKKKDAAEIILRVLNPGDVIGTLTMISKSPRTSSSRAKTRCVLLFYSNEVLKDSFKDIPVWSQSVIKDAITRIQEIDDKLMESTLREKSLQKNLGTIFHHTAQLSYLLATFMRKATIIDDTKTPLYPVKDFLPQAEFILLKKFAYLEKIFLILQQNNIFQIQPHQKYGLVIVKPNPQLLEDYSNFSLSVSKKGIASFVPSRYHKYMTALVKISKSYNNLEKFEKKQLAEFLKAEVAKDDVDEVLKQLTQFGVIAENESSYHVSPSKIQKTIVFENIAKSLKEISL